MRQVLKSTGEVFHFWANRVQESGESGSVSFRGDRLYSYAANIARLLPNGCVVFTNRTYSVTTSAHVSKAKAAASHLVSLCCFDPAADCRSNMARARETIRDHLTQSERKGIRQTTRENLKAMALQAADSANAYLQGLPEGERNDSPIDTSDLEAVRKGLLDAEAAQATMRAEQQAATAVRLAETLDKWKTGEVVASSGLYQLPPALRLITSRGTFKTGGLLPDRGSEGKQAIQTSHGAEIPVADAIRLWPIVQNVRTAGEDWTSPVLSRVTLGHYTLTQIKKDGSIVVGCHEIAYAELERMAKVLKLAE